MESVFNLPFDIVLDFTLPTTSRTNTPHCVVVPALELAERSDIGQPVRDADTLRLALELASLACDLAEQEYPNQDAIAKIREQVHALRYSSSTRP